MKPHIPNSKKSFLIGLALHLSGFAIGQSSTNPELFGSAGGVETTEQFLVSYSFGEPITTTVSNESYTLTQGFQQSSLMVTSISEKDKTGIGVYPNPATNKVLINIPATNQLDLNASLFDSNGKVVAQKNNLRNGINELNLESLATGVYVLRLNSSTDIILSSKIIKQ